MVVLVTCKNEEDPIKNRGARLVTTLYINFSDAQGQITLQLVVVSGRNSNSFKLSGMSSLPARMKMIESKMKELEWSYIFPIISLWEFFLTLKGSLLHSPWSDLVEFRTRPKCYKYSCYLQVRRRSDQKCRRLSVHNIFPIITLRELSVAIETRVQIRSGPKPKASFL